MTNAILLTSAINILQIKYLNLLILYNFLENNS
ncbi:hypothetical protein BMF77_00030 [Dolichospermum sp. UHCC 0315A]|jgi:hypothetical protein|nr:hypothetical protein BMF77_00030 [Dolichospermum sp. UHCC 0315A]